MRQFLIPLLMASVVLPAAAYARPDNNESRQERSSENRSDRSSEHRSERASERRSERSSDNRPQRVERVQRAERAAPAERSDRSLRIRQPQVQPVQQQEVRQVRRSDRNSDNGIRRVNRDRQDRTEVRRHGDGSFSGVSQRTVERHVRTPDRRWSSDWRRDHRYDWRSHRNSHRSLFRLGRYYDPYGWNYRRFSIGFNIGSSYYGSNYWLDDPWMYRLPPAYGPYRWVRYYDDALLVNIYTGQVADVLYNFFW